MSEWDLHFLAMAELVSRRSKDPSTRCGAVIVDAHRRVVSTGYNGFPRGVPDDAALLNQREHKLRLTLHAEHNAILFAQRPLDGCTIYVHPMPPCAHCAAQIAQTGIVRVVSRPPTREQEQRWGIDFDLARWVFERAGIQFNTTSLEA